MTLRLNKWLIGAWLASAFLSFLVIADIFFPIQITQTFGNIPERGVYCAVAWMAFSILVLMFGTVKK